MPGGNTLLFWTHLGRLPSSDSWYQLDSDLYLPITSPFYPIFILFSGSQSHGASFENGNLALSKTEAPPVSPTKLSNEVGELESEKQELSGHLLL